MSFRNRVIVPVVSLVFAFALAVPLSATAAGAPKYEVDVKDAEALLRSGRCARCHEIDKAKKGKPYQETAEEYRDKPDAIQNIVKHITEPKQVEVDGEMVDHGTVKTRDQSRIENLARWILSQ